MAWTAPMTFVDGVPLTASQLNTHLRDNMLESATAKATTAGGYFVSVGPNEITERVPASNLVSATDSTASTSFDDLDSTTGPVITAMTGTAALITISATISATGTAISRMGYEVTGASSLSADNSRCLRNTGTSAFTASYSEYRTGLTPGLNTFTAKYQTSTGTASFGTRRLTVFPR